jgi:DivIVA domain-containing protein
MESYPGFCASFRAATCFLLGVDHKAMAHEIRPDEIREAKLNRRLRGYDQEETEQLLADVAESYEKVLTEREALTERFETLQHEQAERERGWRLQLERLHERLSDRERRVSGLEAKVARLEQELEKTRRLSDEPASAQAAKDGLRSELAERGERLARLETEQIGMLEAQLEQADETGSAPPARRAMALLEGRAARTIVGLDHLIERAQRDGRRDAEILLKKARERADELVRSTEMEREPSPESPVIGGSQTDGEEEMGEAAWTSPIGSDQIPERSS